MAAIEGNGMGVLPKYRNIPSNVSNRRNAVRIRTIRNARIKFGNTNLDCVLLDFSSRGARVNVGSATDLPKKLVIVLHDNSSHNATLRWARDREIGLEFIKDSEDSPADGPSAARSDAASELGRMLFQGDAGRLADASPAQRARVAKAAKAMEEACQDLRKALEACDH
ncbi:PilZ domain-containing protein [Sabulicella glaciei]|uniref:PilZ domain-containing protein n=1 Tax=Sabulicella glaciei TaxID=2984948 RepID=A0ABT3NYU3_9PROT|nr:PilZ domain-containing protein [Roseococcus sp. MDT2-1-1]MCW8087336.1 PilZ domain-containing protein [Roseococcus sp. MDT2-1-1]